MNDAAYLKSLKLKRNPFPVAPDDKIFYVSDHIEQILAEIVHGIGARKGFMVLSGDVGVGKTTITRRILKILALRNVSTSFVFHTSLKDVDLLREINRDFGLLAREADENLQLGGHLKRLNDFLVKQYRAGYNCAIIIDDAQNLDHDSLELIRMISNLEADRQKLVQILLVGQIELMAKLNTHTLRQLHSRIVIRKILRSLSRQELRNYIMFKLSSAGSGESGCIAVSGAAFRVLYRFSGGNMRRLNLLMDRCLYAICNSSLRRIDRHVVRIAQQDLYPQRQRFRKMALAAVSSILIPFVVAMASWGLHLYTSRAAKANVQTINQRYKIMPALLTPESGHPGGIPGPTAADSAHVPSNIHSAVKAFLSVYQLDRYASGFQQALEAGRLDRISRRIYIESGFQLIQLSDVPDRIRRRYGSLTFAVGRDRTPLWLLFWKPRLEVKRFYLNYKSEEIHLLQALLADLQFYHFKIDGVVGPRLISSVLGFQRQQGLPVTGFPDAETLFWLCHQQKEGTPWPKA